MSRTLDFWDAELLDFTEEALTKAFADFAEEAVVEAPADFAEEAVAEAPADFAEEAVAAIAEACNAAGANIAAESKTAEKILFFITLLGIL